MRWWPHASSSAPSPPHARGAARARQQHARGGSGARRGPAGADLVSAASRARSSAARSGASRQSSTPSASAASSTSAGRALLRHHRHRHPAGARRALSAVRPPRVGRPPAASAPAPAPAARAPTPAPRPPSEGHACTGSQPRARAARASAQPRASPRPPPTARAALRPPGPGGGRTGPGAVIMRCLRVLDSPRHAHRSLSVRDMRIGHMANTPPLGGFQGEMGETDTEATREACGRHPG